MPRPLYSRERDHPVCLGIPSILSFLLKKCCVSCALHIQPVPYTTVLGGLNSRLFLSSITQINYTADDVMIEVFTWRYFNLVISSHRCCNRTFIYGRVPTKQFDMQWNCFSTTSVQQPCWYYLFATFFFLLDPQHAPLHKVILHAVVIFHLCWECLFTFDLSFPGLLS
jgi:hypothetical protein